MIVYRLGMTEHKTGSHGVMSLANLALITGNVSRPNTRINSLHGQNNVQGSCDMGALPDIYTCYQKVDDPAITQANVSFVKSAMKKLDLLVVQDIFMTETARLAHVVLPASCFFDRSGGRYAGTHPGI